MMINLRNLVRRNLPVKILALIAAIIMPKKSTIL